MAAILDLTALQEGMVLSDSVVYLQGYKKRAYADGKKFYIAGTFVNQNASIPFKIWDAALVDALSTTDVAGRVVKITGSVTSYQNSLEVKVQSIDPQDSVEQEFPKVNFLKTVDVKTVYDDFVNMINTKLSEKGVQVLMTIFKTEKLFGRFKEEFAGSKMHDAQVGGLLNHTTKMLHIAEAVANNDKRLAAIPDYLDLLYLGVILHDVGKVHEMNMGVYQPNSFVTHRTLGVEMVCRYKEQIVSAYDEKFFYQILAILQGHHGEYGDKPTTVMSYLIHLIDMVESTITGILDKIDNNDTNSFAGAQTVYAHDGYLTI